MAAKGRLYGLKYGVDNTFADPLAQGGIITYAMATQSKGYCARFVATSNSIVTGVKVYWGSVSTPSAVTVRHETITVGHIYPSGTLIDAQSTVSANPTSGLQTFTFGGGTPPTTAMTAGTAYGLVISTPNTGATTQTLNAYPSASSLASAYPIAVLTTATSGTNTSYAEVVGAVPMCSLVLSGGAEDSMGMQPFGTLAANNLITSATTLGAALKLVTSATLSVAGVEFFSTKNGTPTGDLRVRILNGASALVSGATITIPNALLITNAAARREQAFFPGLVSLPSGTYYVIFDDVAGLGAADTSSTNCWRLIFATPFGSSDAPSGLIGATCPDSSTPVWTTDANFGLPPVRLILDDLTVPAASGGVSLARVVNGGGF